MSWLFLGRIIAGISGASFTTATAYIADISEPEKRAQNFGLVGAAFGLGFIIGPVVGGISAQWGARIPFIAASVLTLMNFLYGYFFIPESLDRNNRRNFEWKRANPVSSLLNLKRYPAVSSLAACLMLIYIASHAVQSNWSYYTMLKFSWNEAMVGYSLGFVGVLVSLVQGGLIRIVIPKIGQIKSIYAGLAFYAIGLLLFAFASSSWMMYAFLIPYCLGGLAGPALQGYISNHVPANEQGELQGALTSLISVTSIIGPVLMNGLFAYFTSAETLYYFPGAPFILASMMILVSIVLAVKSFTVGKK
jgi:DHA1 family tetracycline resistance protein-like MFS transporter